jgi:hypothetical protein
MDTGIDRCAECGAELTGGVCGTCRPTGRPADKGLRRIEAGAAEHEKEQWDRHLVDRKSHPRPHVASSATKKKQKG